MLTEQMQFAPFTSSLQIIVPVMMKGQGHLHADYEILTRIDPVLYYSIAYIAVKCH